jgi:hypothetical protein
VQNANSRQQSSSTSNSRISSAETNVLQQTTAALGITQHDYNHLQARHREKLSVHAAE